MKGRKMSLKNKTVILEKNYLEWQRVFESEKEILKNIFQDLAIKIEHIGSTSIEDLSAKPIIDIAIAVNHLEKVENMTDELSKHYTIKNSPEKEEILLIKENNQVTDCLIHVMNINSERYQNTILFRDYLRSHKNERKEYEQLKIHLATKYKNNREMYTKSKNNFIKEILIKAKNKKN